MPDAFIAAGELALSKSDFALAAEEFDSAAETISPTIPTFILAWRGRMRPSDNEQANTKSASGAEDQPATRAEFVAAGGQQDRRGAVRRSGAG